MAKSKDPKETAQEGKAPEPKKKSEGGGGNKSFIILFSVIIAVQLVIIIILVYFYISRPPLPHMHQSQQVVETVSQPAKADKKTAKKVEEDDDEEEEESSSGPVIIYETDVFIVNPKGARPGRLLQAQVGLSVSSEEAKKEFEEARKAQINDILTGYLASQTYEYLSDITKRDTLKMEMKQLLNKSIKGKKIRDVFFSRYVVQ